MSYLRSFVCTFLNGIKYFHRTLIILFDINLHTNGFKYFYLTLIILLDIILHTNGFKYCYLTLICQVFQCNRNSFHSAVWF